MTVALHAFTTPVKLGTRAHRHICHHPPPPPQDLEITFSPEIGDATVGSLIVSTSKDSCLDGPGYLSACVKQVTYVNQVTSTASAADAGRRPNRRKGEQASGWIAMARAQLLARSVRPVMRPAGSQVHAIMQEGDLVTLDSQDQRREYLAFSGSYGAMGVVVEATLYVRKRVSTMEMPTCTTIAPS